MVVGMSAFAETKTEGFEKATAATNYQGTVNISSENSDCGLNWEIFYGNVSTSSAIAGNNSAALRLYTSDNYGYIKTTSPIEDLSKVSFSAKAASTNGANIKINVSYSTDGSDWTNIKTSMSLTSTADKYSVDIPAGGKYFMISIASTSTKPSKSSAQLTIDNVEFINSGESGETPSTPEKTDITNTQETAYTVAQAISLTDDANSDLTKQVYVKGIVSEIVTPWSEQYKNITYNISDDGSDTGAQFQLYRCTTNGAEVGDVVIAYGTLKKHNSTYEFNSGNSIVDIQKAENPVTLTSIAISGTPTKTSYYAGDKFETAGLVVTGTYSDGTSKELTEGVEWTVDPETLTVGTTSVDVLAGIGEVVSEVFTVNGLTVTKASFETATYTFSEFTAAQNVELTDLDGFVITLSRGEGTTNPSWVSSQARIYAKGYLTVKANNAIIQSIEYDYVVNANKNNVAPTIDGVEGKSTAGTWNAESKTWTGSDSEVTFSTSGTAGNIGFTKLIIKYVPGSKTETSLTWSATEAEVTIDAKDNVFPTLTTTPADLSGVTYESSNTKVATIAEDGTVTLVAAGTTTITARFAATEDFAEASPVSYTLTVNNAPFVPTSIDADFETANIATLYSDGTTSADIATYYGTSYMVEFAKGTNANGNVPKYYDNGKAVRAYTGNTITITAADPIKNVLVNYVSSSYADDGAKTEIDGKNATITFSKGCRFTSIVVVYANPTLAIGSTGYATYYNSKVAYIMPEGCTGSIFTVAGGLKATYEAGDAVPADEALVISGTPGDKELVLTTTNKSNSAGSNDLKGTDEEQELEEYGGFYYYALSVDKEGKNVGFYWMNSTGAAFKNGAHKAYLMAAGSSANAKNFIFGETAAIKTIATATDAKIYDLTGREVKSPKAGIYVVNGVKKYIK